MNFDYATNHTPPIPVMKIRLGYPGEALTIGPLEAIIDTGADATLIPRYLIDELEAPFVDDAWISSPWGEWMSVQTFTLDIGLEQVRLPAVRAVATEENDEIILGRNVLNKLHLTLDGPKQITMVNL